MAPNDSSPVIVLAGMRGSGKTAVGRCVARTLTRPFLDLDDEVLRREGHESVAAMWDALGQPAFRAAETRALRAVLDSDARGKPGVVALGGGTLTAPGAMETLAAARARGAVFAVYLRCSAQTLRARLARTVAHDANRPSVTGADPIQELSDLLRAREASYRASCDAEIDAESGSPEDVALLVVRALRDHAARR